MRERERVERARQDKGNGRRVRTWAGLGGVWAETASSLARSISASSCSRVSVFETRNTKPETLHTLQNQNQIRVWPAASAPPPVDPHQSLQPCALYQPILWCVPASRVLCKNQVRCKSIKLFSCPFILQFLIGTCFVLSPVYSVRARKRHLEVTPRESI